MPSAVTTLRAPTPLFPQHILFQLLTASATSLLRCVRVPCATILLGETLVNGGATNREARSPGYHLMGQGLGTNRTSAAETGHQLSQSRKIFIEAEDGPFIMFNRHFHAANAKVHATINRRRPAQDFDRSRCRPGPLLGVLIRCHPCSREMPRRLHRRLSRQEIWRYRARLPMEGLGQQMDRDPGLLICELMCHRISSPKKAPNSPPRERAPRWIGMKVAGRSSALALIAIGQARVRKGPRQSTRVKRDHLHPRTPALATPAPQAHLARGSDRYALIERYSAIWRWTLG
jgi:hypothetical protein